MTIYYVYAYLRNKDSKTAKAGTPYYIGKGCRKRAWQKHQNSVMVPKKENIIILENNLTEIGAFAIERRLIRWFGRKNIKTGILVNLTDGGEGVSGYQHTEYAKNKMSETRTGKKQSSETRLKLSNIHKGRTAPNKGVSPSPETRIKLSIANKNKKKTEEVKNKIRLSHLGKKHTTEHRENHRNAVKNYRPSDETKMKIGDFNRGMKQWNNGYINKNSKTCPGPEWVHGFIKKQCNNMKYWTNGEIIKKSEECPGEGWYRGRKLNSKINNIHK
jgi:hypothetical protein